MNVRSRRKRAVLAGRARPAELERRSFENIDAVTYAGPKRTLVTKAK